jgi:hypothetical protein
MILGLVATFRQPLESLGLQAVTAGAELRNPELQGSEPAEKGGGGLAKGLRSQPLGIECKGLYFVQVALRR